MMSKLFVYENELQENNRVKKSQKFQVVVYNIILVELKLFLL